MAHRRAARPSSRPEGGEAAQAPPADHSLDLSALTEITGYPLRRAQLAVFEDFNRRFASIGLSPAQYSALVAIGDNPGRKQSEIAGALGIQRPNFVAMMDELERRGLAKRLRSDADRRSHALALTQRGSELVARARLVQAEQESAIARLLGPKGRERLVALLRRLANIE
jgi:DNA-binding MarR family transcriptional regulator